MTEQEKMLAGELYDPSDAELTKLRLKAHRLSREYNGIPEENDAEKTRVLDEMGIKRGENVYLLAPVQFDYGCFTTIGANTFANFNFTVLDCAPVTIGENVFMGPNISILTPVHPMRWQERNQFTKPDGTWTDQEYARPITIQKNCWISGNVTICGGVTVGEGSIIGAGSVVTRDIPPNVIAAGVPCRVIREITDDDKMGYSNI